jgi:hypothetical protein
MSNYTKATNFAAKDGLPTSDPAKIIKGTDIDNEFNAIASAVSSKADSNSPTLTGTPLAPTAASGTNTTQIATTAFVTAATGTAANIAGGAANRIVYQSALDTTAFAPAPTVTGTYLGWTGSAFAWSTISATTSAALTMNNSGSGDSSGATFNGSIAKTISYNTIGAPSTSGTGATGTWGINITGSSGSTAFASTAGSAGGLTGSPSVTISSSTCSGTFVATTGFQVGGSAGNGMTFSGGYTQLVCNGSGTLSLDGSGNIIINGSIAQKASGTTWNNPSDVRLKKDIVNYTDGLNKLLQVTPKTWLYNGLGNTTNGQKGLGVIADEIISVLPETVSTYSAKLNPEDSSNTEIKQFDATEITWLLVNAVKELKVALDVANAKITALENG